MSETVNFERDIIAGLLKLAPEAKKVVVTFSVEYFTAKELRLLFSIIKEYYDKYNEVPDADIVANELTKQSTVSNETVNKMRMFVEKVKESKVEESKFRYAIEEVEKSYTTRRLKDSMKEAVILLDKGLPVQAQDLMLRNLIDLSAYGREIQVVDFVEGFGQRVKNLLKRKENPDLLRQVYIPSGIPDLDEELDGGLRKGELGLWLAAPEGGKSISLQNIAINGALAGYSVALFTIEMTPEQTAYRLDSALTGIRYKAFRRAEIEETEIDYWQETLKKLPPNRLKIIGVPEGCTCRLIEAELKRLGGIFRPDLIVVDYAGIMSPNEGRYQSSMDWKYVGEIVRNLKGLALKLNVPVWSASQLLVNSKEKESVSFGDIGLARQQIAAHADVCIAIIRTSQMVEMDTARLQFVKAREGVMRRYLDVNTDFDRIRLHKGSTETENISGQEEQTPF